jgi:hypothetical protein
MEGGVRNLGSPGTEGLARGRLVSAVLRGIRGHQFETKVPGTSFRDPLVQRGGFGWAFRGHPVEQGLINTPLELIDTHGFGYSGQLVESLELGYENTLKSIFSCTRDESWNMASSLSLGTPKLARKTFLKDFQSLQ